MIESNVDVAANNLKSLITPKLIQSLKEQSFSGAKVLINKLKSDVKSDSK